MNVKAGVMIIVMTSRKQISLQILYSVNESANPSGVQKHSIFVSWPPKDIFPHQVNFFFPYLLKYKEPLFRWQSPKARMLPSLSYIIFTPQYSFIMLIDLLHSSWTNWCSIISIDAQGSGEPCSKWNTGFGSDQQ